MKSSWGRWSQHSEKQLGNNTRLWQWGRQQKRKERLMQLRIGKTQKRQDFSKSQILQLSNGYNRLYLTDLLWELNERMHIKDLVQSLAYAECSVNCDDDNDGIDVSGTWKMSRVGITKEEEGWPSRWIMKKEGEQTWCWEGVLRRYNFLILCLRSLSTY